MIKQEELKRLHKAQVRRELRGVPLGPKGDSEDGGTQKGLCSSLTAQWGSLPTVLHPPPASSSREVPVAGPCISLGHKSMSDPESIVIAIIIL